MSVPFITNGNVSYVQSGDNYTITFLGNGNITFTNSNFFVSYLVVGGGGGGGNNDDTNSANSGGGGGGGGEVVIGSFTNSLDNTYNIIIGQGGNGAPVTFPPDLKGFDGQNTIVSSSLINITAIGGQGGQVAYSSSSSPGFGGNSGAGGFGGTSSYGLGSNGGNGTNGGGGGGGNVNGGNGGINTINANYGGGGGGGGTGVCGTGVGGGANGSGENSNGINGTPNTGGGGGGTYGPAYTYAGGNGGSGIVILYYSKITQTGYTVYNPNTSSYQDLFELFQPYSGGTKAPLTYYNVNGTDLNNLFNPISVGTMVNFNTNIKVNGNDLKNIFAAYEQPLYTVTGNPTITQSTNYTFITYENNGTLIFNTINSVTLNYLMVGGGGSGGAGGSGTGSEFCGGGGASGTILQYNITVLPNNIISLSIGNGGVCSDNGSGSYTPNLGSQTTINYNTNTIAALGGQPGQNGPVPYNNTPVLGGISTSGNGGNGDNLSFINPQYNYVGTDASGYIALYQNFTIDNVNLGTFGGGGGGGTLNTGGGYYTGQGSGGNGGYNTYISSTTTYYPPFAGTNGGGGGGATTSNTNQNPAQLNQAGANGGNGIAIVWFSNNIS